MVAIFTVLCLAISLWPAQATGMPLDAAKGRHIAGLGGHAAVLAASERLREQVPGPHQSVAGVSVYAFEAPGAARPLWSAARPVQSPPSYRVATHLSL